MLCSTSGEFKPCLNLASYNYLGFADDWKTSCQASVLETAAVCDTSCCAPPLSAGYTVLHKELEAMVARFVAKPAAIVFNMGYNTNAGSVPILAGKVTAALPSPHLHAACYTL